jgi:hypothetical protein
MSKHPNNKALEQLDNKHTRDVAGYVSQRIQSNLAWVLTSDSGKDLLNLNIYPNVKEISEASSITRFLHKQYRPWTKYNDVLLVVIGDGASPRLGAMVAFHTAWNVVSIDPLLNMEKARKNGWDKVKRLTMVPSKYEDVNEHRSSQSIPGGIVTHSFIPNIELIKHTIYAFPHSHVNMDDALEKLMPIFGTPVGVVSMPCCVKQNTLDDIYPTVVYEDWGCLSEKRVINWWDWK